ncbi:MULTISPECIES: hypothetical protein [Neisseriaceae]|uniref:hypothetical protein n=1 Tax=Neisseriaceae TaxID=481 RepID=UPI0015F6DFC0|nr:hypothetical protein [Neisseria bacilliformis]QMT47665.1 hypothetical protein H3L91_00450 [Neisseria bacilliformis]
MHDFAVQTKRPAYPAVCFCIPRQPDLHHCQTGNRYPNQKYFFICPSSFYVQQGDVVLQFKAQSLHFSNEREHAAERNPKRLVGLVKGQEK